MPRLASLAASGMCLPLSPGLPAVTCPVQATLTTGTRVRDHQIVANGIYDRSTHHLEMWISPDSAHKAPRIWDELQAAQPALRTAAWFALQSKYATADLVCLPAPKHNPDGSETMWCHTRPDSLYEKLREKLGDFPLHKFWGPIAGIESSRWIARSFVEASRENPPHFAYVYLPHLDYAAQRSGPDSQPAHTACGELDAEIGKLIDDFGTAVGRDPLVVLVAGEYRIRPVSHTLFPNRILRTAGLLAVIDSPEGELLDRQASQAWAAADHQVSHIYLRDGSDQNSVEQVASLFRDQAGVGQVLAGAELLAADLLAVTPLAPPAAAVTSWLSAPSTAGRVITTGWTMPEPQPLHARSTSTANLVTIQSSSTSIEPLVVFLWMFRLSRDRTALLIQPIRTKPFSLHHSLASQLQARLRCTRLLESSSGCLACRRDSHPHSSG